MSHKMFTVNVYGVNHLCVLYSDHLPYVAAQHPQDLVVKPPLKSLCE